MMWVLNGEDRTGQQGRRGTAIRILRSVIATNGLITLPDGHREVIADAALEDMARQVNEGGGRPQLIEHDWLRPCGWATRAWTERDGNSLKLLMESIVPENSDEWRLFSQKYAEYLSAMSAQRCEPYLGWVQTLKQPDVSLAFDTDCVYLHAPKLAERVFPSVFAHRDDDGLIPLEQATIGDNGWLVCGDYFLVPSPFLRLGFSLPNAPNRSFLSSFLGLAKKHSGRGFSLALDPDLLAIPASLKPTEQREFWWGPPYRGRPSAQPYGITVHGPTKYDCLNGLVRTEFWWYGKSERTFEMEELVHRADIRGASESARCMRFVHSIFEGNSDNARHLDGAVRHYTEQLWQVRIDSQSKLSTFGKQAKRVKVWRADGSLCPKIWYELIHNFYHGNFTVGEYFGLPDPRDYQSQLASQKLDRK